MRPSESSKIRSASSLSAIRSALASSSSEWTPSSTSSPGPIRAISSPSTETEAEETRWTTARTCGCLAGDRDLRGALRGCAGAVFGHHGCARLQLALGLDELLRLLRELQLQRRLGAVRHLEGLRGQFGLSVFECERAAATLGRVRRAAHGNPHDPLAHLGLLREHLHHGPLDRLASVQDVGPVGDHAVAAVPTQDLVNSAVERLDRVVAVAAVERVGPGAA